MAQKWAGWLHNPCRVGGPQRFGAEDKITSGPQMGRVTKSLLPHIGVPNASLPGTISTMPHKWSRVATSPLPPNGLPHASQQGTKSEIGRPYRLGLPQRFTAGHKIRSNPQVGRVAT